MLISPLRLVLKDEPQTPVNLATSVQMSNHENNPWAHGRRRCGGVFTLRAGGAEATGSVRRCLKPVPAGARARGTALLLGGSQSCQERWQR